jgi:AcrR family transcriptional regulator
MEASVRSPERKLDGDKAQRIVAAMRSSVGRRGAAGSTFDHVAAEAGVSRGLLHYYFGSKERLLVEVVRQDCDIRLERLESGLRGAHTLDAIIEVLVVSVRSFVAEDPAAQALLYEMFSASRTNDEIAAEFAALYRRTRAVVADALRDKESEGAVSLRGDAESVAAILFSLGDGFELQLISDPAWDSSDAFELGIQTARFLLGADETQTA